MSQTGLRMPIAAVNAVPSVGHGRMSRIGSREQLRRFPFDVVRLVGRRSSEIRQVVTASRDGLERHQRATLDLGGWLVLSVLGLGLQLGRWSVWSVLPASGGYLIWVLAYSEATVQATRRRRGDRSPRSASGDGGASS